MINLGFFLKFFVNRAKIRKTGRISDALCN